MPCVTIFKTASGCHVFLLRGKYFGTPTAAGSCFRALAALPFSAAKHGLVWPSCGITNFVPNRGVTVSPIQSHLLLEHAPFHGIPFPTRLVLVVKIRGSVDVVTKLKTKAHWIPSFLSISRRGVQGFVLLLLHLLPVV